MYRFKKYLPYYKRNLKLAWPIMLAQAGQTSVQLVDAIMVGHLGTTELAAVSFANSVFIIGFVFGMGFTFGITPLVGQAFGNNDSKRVGDLFTQSFILNTILSLMLSMLIFGVSYAMPYMGQPKGVVELAIPFYRILVFSMLPFLFFFTLKQFLEGLGQIKIATGITISANILNIILNYILIYGHFGFSNYGVNGAGYATFIARLTMPIILMVYFYNSQYYVKYKSYFSFNSIHWKDVWSLFMFNIPIAFQIVIEVVAFAFGGLMMGWFGEVALAAHQIALGLASFTYMIASGIGSATTIRVSHQLGSGHFKALRIAGFSALHVVVAFMSMTALVFIIFRNELPLLFTNDIKVIELAAILLIMAGVFQVIDGLQLVSMSALRALSDVKYAMYLSIVAYGIITLGGAYLFSVNLNMGPIGIWMGFVIGLLLAAVLLVNRYNKLTRIA